MNEEKHYPKKKYRRQVDALLWDYIIKIEYNSFFICMCVCVCVVIGRIKKIHGAIKNLLLSRFLFFFFYKLLFYFDDNYIFYIS